MPQRTGESCEAEGEKNVAGISPTLERHYTVAEVAKLWNLRPDAVRRLFRNEPGVLILGDANPRGKRRYLTIRIPVSVLERVHRHFINAHLFYIYSKQYRSIC